MKFKVFFLQELCKCNNFFYKNYVNVIIKKFSEGQMRDKVVKYFAIREKIIKYN